MQRITTLVINAGGFYMWQYPKYCAIVVLVSIDSMGIVPRLPFSETERGFYGHVRNFDIALSGICRFGLHR